MRSYWAKNKGGFPSRASPRCTVIDESYIESSSSEKLNLERKSDPYEKGQLHVEFASSLQQLFASSSDSGQGFKQLELSNAMTATKRLTMSLAWTSSIHSVISCWVFLNATHSTSKLLLITDADAFIHKRNASLREKYLGKRWNDGSWGLLNGYGTKSFVTSRRCHQGRKTSNNPPW